MRRLHLFELEDLPWFPAPLRDFMTDWLEVLNRALAPYDCCLPLLEGLLARSPGRQILDLCSGGGGPWPGWLARGRLEAHVTLTDRYPNLKAFSRLAQGHPSLTFHPDPVDATQVPPSLTGVRTLFTALHHLEPESVRAMMADAARAHQPLAAFDFNCRHWTSLLIVPPGAWLMCWLLTPLLPLSWSRLALTYLLPAVPLSASWDGLVSQLRSYTVAELEELANSVSCPGYRWEVGQRRSYGVVPVTYLLGYPG